MASGYAPLSRNIKYWPSYFGDTPEWLDEVGFSDYEVYDENASQKVSGQIAILRSLSFPAFGLPGIRIAFLNGGGITLINFEATIGTQFQLSVVDLNISLLVESEWLVPVELSPDGDWVPIMEGGEPKPFEITLGGVDCTYSTPSELNFDTSNLNAGVDTVALGNTGIIVGLQGVIPYLSNQQISPPGHPGFRGVGIEDVLVTLPFEIDEGNSVGIIVGNDILIGSTGFSGQLLLTSDTGEAPLLSVTIGGFSLELTCFSLTFFQNQIIDSEICGTMQIPGFEDAAGNAAEIEIEVHIGDDGEFYIAAAEDQGLQEFRVPNILTLRINNVVIGRREGRYFLAVGGLLDFDPKDGVIGQALPQGVQISKLLIWEDGSYEFEGGALVLPETFTIPLGPVKISITALHIGTDERDGVRYKYIGFDGGISINPSGIDARGDGLKYYFTEGGGSHFFRIEGIGIDMVLPGNVSEDKAALLLSGYLAMREGGEHGVEYAGSVAFSLPKLNIGGSAGMRYIPQVPAFLIDVGVELPNAIPLGSTGLGIYGFEAMFGRHFVVSKQAIGLSDEAPWFDYYKAPARGINPPKFFPIGGTSMGAGVLLGTSADSGYAFSSRLFFLLSLPGVFLLEGEAQLLRKRVGFASQNRPPFYAFLAITDSSVEAGLGVDYKIPASGSIAEISGALELGFFFGNSTGWYMNIGRDLPENKRVQAKLLRIIDRAYFYLMLSASGTRAGAGAGLGIDKRFGPAHVKLQAYLDLAGRLSSRPMQIGGAIQAGIEGKISLFGVGIGIGAHFALSVDAPKPFIIAGEVYVCVKLIFVKKCAGVRFEWNFSNDLNLVAIQLLEANSVQALNVHTGENYDVAFNSSPSDNEVIPLDSFVDIEFKHAVNPLGVTNKIGGVSEVPRYRELLPPQRARAPQLTYEFIVDNVILAPHNVAPPLLGFWQWNAPGHYTKIRLLSLSPLSFLGSGVPGGPSWSSDNALLSMECVGTVREEICIDLNAFGGSGLLPAEALLSSQGVGLMLSSGLAGTIDTTGLCFNAGQSLTIYFPEPVVFVSLSLFTSTSGLSVRYYRRVANAGLEYQDQLVDMSYLPGSMDEPSGLLYDNAAVPIEKIVIESGFCDEVPGGGEEGSSIEDITCKLDAIVSIMGLISELFRHESGFPGNPLAVTSSEWIPFVYKYLLTDVFNLCSSPPEPYSGQDLAEYYLGILPEVTVQHIPTDESYGVYEIDIPGCVKFTLDIQLPKEQLTSVVRFECLSLTEEPCEGLFGFEGQAVQKDGTSIPFKGCLGVEFVRVNYGEPLTCISKLQGLCYQTLEDFQYNELVEATNSANNAGADINVMGSSFGQVIWEPDTTYEVTVHATTKVFKDGTELVASYSESHTVEFRTEGPPGFFHQFPDGTLHPKYAALPAELKEKFKLKDLRHYIDLSTSYPNADGNLINAKPIFFEDVGIGLFFKQAYVRTMYSGSYRLGLKILDPARIGQNAEVSFAEWVAGSTVESIEINAINEILGSVACLGTEQLSSSSQGAVFNKDLRPLKCYTAVFLAIKGDQEREVHRYVFETSRYPNFRAQVNSYLLEDADGNDVEAAYLLRRNWGAFTIPSFNPEDVLAYDQLVYETLGLTDLTPAENTEFLLLYNNDTDSLIGVIVRNPEPFNDPKISTAILTDGMTLEINGVSLSVPIIYKDTSSMLFLADSNLAIGNEVTINAGFTFKQYEPDTGGYQNSSFVPVSFTKVLSINS